MITFLRELRLRLIQSLILFIRIMPYPLATFLGRLLGTVAWICIPLHRKIVAIQMKATVGYKPFMSLKVFRSQGEQIIDMIKYLYMDQAEIRRRVMILGRENLQQALSDKRGIMFISGHIGPWELLTHIPRLLDIQCSAMADMRDDPRLNKLFKRIYAGGGTTILPPKGGMIKTLSRELKAGRNIGIAIDQRSNRSNRLLCNFLGLQTPTSPAPAYVALMGDALLVPVHVVKQRSKRLMIFGEPRAASSFGSLGELKLKDAYQSEAVRKLSDYCQAWASQVISQHPEQWFWVHSRWTRRSDMQRIIKNKLNFNRYISDQAQAIESGEFSNQLKSA